MILNIEKSSSNIFWLKKTNGFPIFKVTIEINKYSLDSYVETNFNLDEKNNIGEENSEIYLKGFIKADGCSHFWFVDDGYIHICGKENLLYHIDLMKFIWDLASKLVTTFDKKEIINKDD